MGLLDHLPNGLLELILKNRNSNSALEADNTRLPLSLAGPEPAASRGPLFSADAAPPQLSDHFTASLPTQMPTTPNLTAQVLRQKGVSEAEIAAGMNDPDVMRQILIQHYAHGFSGLPASLPNVRNRTQFDGSDSNYFRSRSTLDREAPEDGPALAQPVGFKCDGFSGGCKYGGNYGDNSMYRFDIGDLCRKCAIKWTGASNLPADQQMEILEPFLIKMK